MTRGQSPNYWSVSTPFDMAAAKDRYNNKNKNFQEDVNMNRALIKCFLSLFTPVHSQACYTVLVADLGQQFGVTLAYLDDI